MKGYAAPDGVTGKFNPALLSQLVPVSELVEDPENARLHDDENLDSIRASLDMFGQVKPIVYWTKGGQKMVLAGNGTYRTAVALGWTHIAAIPYEAEERFARGFAIADNRTAELARWNIPVLQSQMEALSVEWSAAGEEWSTENIGFSGDAFREFEERPTTETKEEPAPEDNSERLLAVALEMYSLLKGIISSGVLPEALDTQTRELLRKIEGK